MSNKYDAIGAMIYELNQKWASEGKWVKLDDKNKIKYGDGTKNHNGFLTSCSLTEAEFFDLYAKEI